MAMRLEGQPSIPANKIMDYYRPPLTITRGLSPEPAPYGYREDGTAKGSGYFGNNARGDDPHMVSGELSGSTQFTKEGKTVLFPLLQPTLSPEEYGQMMAGSDWPDADSIYAKGEAFARQRLASGKSQWAEPNEQYPIPRTR